MAEAAAGVGKSHAYAAAQNSLKKTLGAETSGIADKSESWIFCSSNLPD